MLKEYRRPAGLPSSGASSWRRRLHRSSQSAERLIHGFATWRSSAAPWSALPVNADRRGSSWLHRRVHIRQRGCMCTETPLWPSVRCAARATYVSLRHVLQSCGYGRRSLSSAAPAAFGRRRERPPLSRMPRYGIGRRVRMCTHHATLRSGGRSRAMDPYGKVVRAMLRPATLVHRGHSLWERPRSPTPSGRRFPPCGGNPGSGLDRLPRSGLPHGDPRLVLRGARPSPCCSLPAASCLSVWRVWLQPRARERARRGTLPPLGPPRPRTTTPSLVIGELHHPVVPRESERPSWLVVPETGLYTGVLIVGAVGSGKTSACMYPFAQQLLSWQADRPARRVSALGARGQGRLLPQVGQYDREHRPMRSHSIP